MSDPITEPADPVPPRRSGLMEFKSGGAGKSTNSKSELGR
jgi:hypothetical protein